MQPLEPNKPLGFGPKNFKFAEELLQKKICIYFIMS